jgi:hypothetical protein
MNQPQPVYVPQMASIAERVNKPPRLIQCIQMHNESEFAEIVLGSIYDEVDQIIVIEGAVENRPNSTDDGHSTDDTIEIVERFRKEKDPDKKIMFIKINKPWKDLEEMKNTFLQMCMPGDWVIINDADELYKPEDIRRLRVAIDLNPHATEFVPLFLHFYRDFQHIAFPGPEWQPQHQRIFKFTAGMQYHTHPVVTDPAGRCTYFSPEYQPRRVMLDNFFIFHYGYARANMDEVMRGKQEYYDKELAKHGGANKAFDQKIKDWFDGTEPYVLFDGEHPEAIKSHPMFDYRDERLVKMPGQATWRDVAPYREALAGEPYGNIWLCQTGQAQPRMAMYHNGMTVSHGGPPTEVIDVDLDEAGLANFGSCNIVGSC